MKEILQTIEETRAVFDRVDDDKKMMITNQIVALGKKLVESLTKLEHIPADFETKIRPAMDAQLKAAEVRTERAADTIMGATEEIMNVLPKLQGEGVATVQNAVNKIFEASTFQDLVAQHLNEIKLLINDLHADILTLSDYMHGNEEGAGKNRPQKRPDAHLLNGPRTDV